MSIRETQNSTTLGELLAENDYTPTIYRESNSTKAMSCIPVIGFFITQMADGSLYQQITTPQRLDPQHFIELITEVNIFRVTSIVHNLLSVALTVALVAIGILSPFFGTLIIGPLLFGTISNLYSLYHNHQVISQLEAGSQTEFQVLFGPSSMLA